MTDWMQLLVWWTISLLSVWMKWMLFLLRYFLSFLVFYFNALAFRIRFFFLSFSFLLCVCIRCRNTGCRINNRDLFVHSIEFFFIFFHFSFWVYFQPLENILTRTKYQFWKMVFQHRFIESNEREIMIIDWFLIVAFRINGERLWKEQHKKKIQFLWVNAIWLLLTKPLCILCNISFFFIFCILLFPIIWDFSWEFLLWSIVKYIYFFLLELKNIDFSIFLLKYFMFSSIYIISIYECTFRWSITKVAIFLAFFSTFLFKYVIHGYWFKRYAYTHTEDQFIKWKNVI